MNEDKAARYHRLKRRAGVLSVAWSAAFAGGLLWTGSSVTLRSFADTLAAALGSPSWNAAAVVTFYVASLTLVHELGSLPLAFYSTFLLERRYGLANERFAAWLSDQAKSLAIALIFATGGAGILYFFIRQRPDDWWLATSIVFALLIVGLTKLAPVVLLPLFYRVKPLDRDALRARLLILAERAGAPVLGAYEWGLGDKTKRANAALAGLGTTRRILISDTMLSEYSDEEIEVVLAHELAHHVHGDIWKGLAFESALVVSGFFLAAQALRAFASALGLQGLADPAGLPLVLLAVGAVSLIMLPAAHALSRTCERRADRFALELTENPDAFVSAMRRLAAQNLAEEHPSRVIQWLFYSHPPIRERIAAAQGFSGSGRSGRPAATPTISSAASQSPRW